MQLNAQTLGFFTALCVGFLIGIVRERLHQPGVMVAGVRTHTLAAVMGAVAFSLGLPVFITSLILVGALVAVGYFRSYPKDPGMTGEVSLALTHLLGGFAMQASELAAALGVVVASLLFLKKPLRKFSQELLSEKELEDFLIMFAAALIVLPMLPKEALDPWGTFKPFAIWQIVVLIMSAGMLGHVAIRLSGLKWGLPLAGFFAGFISSTAAMMDFGKRAKQHPEMVALSCASGLLATLSSLFLFAVVLAMSAPSLLLEVVWPLILGAVALVLRIAFLLLHNPLPVQFELPNTEGAFQLNHVFVISLSISSVSLMSHWMGLWFGDSGTFGTAVIVGFAEIHSSAVSIAHLANDHAMPSPLAQWGVICVLAASAVSKTVLSFVVGGPAYGRHVALSLLMFIVTAASSLWIFHHS
jgi:uncharacterized membrane protein (DUF4010 family)